MLAVPVLAFSPYFSQQILFKLASLTFHRFVLNHPVQCRADDINPVGDADFCIHNSDYFRKMKIYQFIEFQLHSANACISQLSLFSSFHCPFYNIPDSQTIIFTLSPLFSPLPGYPTTDFSVLRHFLYLHYCSGMPVIQRFL